MPFLSQPHLARLSTEEQRLLGTMIGYHPETFDSLYIPDIDRFSGIYMLGVQGTGKSGLQQNMIEADMVAFHPVIVIDPHPDLVVNCINHVPKERLKHTYILDMEDEAFPYGCNVFSIGQVKSSLEQTQAVERLMHIFEVLWPEVMSQQSLPRYLRAATLTFLANPGSTLVDMHTFLQDQTFRSRMLSKVTDQSVINFWHTQYDSLGPSEQYRRVQPLIGRLEALFMGRSLVRNIVGQRRTTIDFRKAIEQKCILFIKLPVKKLKQDAQLIGTILLSQISNAIFSFGDRPQEQRPGASLYVDEFQHFATSDFSELLTEGRKFGVRVTVAHQYRDQLPSFLQQSTMTARTKICFQLTPEDGREMAHVFPSSEATVLPEDIELHPVHYLLTHPSTDPVIKLFTDVYLHPLQGRKRGTGRVEIETRGQAPSLSDVWHGGRADNPRVTDPTWQLDSLLYEVMREGNSNLPIPVEIVLGFSNSGRNFFKQARGMSQDDLRLQPDAKFPQHLVVLRNGEPTWSRKPEGGGEQLYHFIFHLRMVMIKLAEHPIGKATTTSTAEVGRMLTNLPKRAAFVRSGDTIGVIYTHNTNPPLSRIELYERAHAILMQTRATYCYPRNVVEQNLLPASQQSPTVTLQPIQGEVIE